MKRIKSVMKRILKVVLLVFTLGGVLVLTSCSNVNKVFDNIVAKTLDSVSVESITYDGSNIKWKSVSGATSYNVQINNEEVKERFGTALSYVNSSNEEFTVSITALGDGSSYKDSETSTRTFVPLENIEGGIKVNDNGSLEWNESNNANGYSIDIDGEETIVNTPSYDELEPGIAHIVKVKPVKTDSPSSVYYYASYTDPVKLSICSDVSEDSIKYQDGIISWAAVNGATTYEVEVNGESYTDITTSKLNYDSNSASFSVTIKAIGDHKNYFDSKGLTTKNFIYLDSVTNVRIDDGTLTWDEVNNADFYKIKINGQVLSGKFTEAKYDKLNAGSTYRVSILPCSNEDTYFSNYSVEESFEILESPMASWTDMTLDGERENSFYWETVNKATGYVVKIVKPDGETMEETFGSEIRTFAYDYPDAGEYKVSVKALADVSSSNVCDSKYSSEISVLRLSAPKAQSGNFIVSNPDKLSDGFTVSYTSVSGATGYRLYKNQQDTNMTSTTTQFKVTNVVEDSQIEEAEIAYSIKSLGKVYNQSTRRVILDSLTDNGLTFDITVLAVPSGANGASSPMISGFEYSYASVNKANGYTVSIGSQTFKNDDLTYNLESLNSGTSKVSVNARGNGSNILSSNYTVASEVYRLDAPSNLKISTETGAEGMLTFSSVNYANSYEVYFGTTRAEVFSNSLENAKQYITTAGTSVYVTAVANVYNEQKTVYYMTSRNGTVQIFKKLPTPTFGTQPFSATQLMWNAVTFEGFTATYRVYDEMNNVYNGEFNGSSMDISYLDGGAEYSFKVQAIGDGNTYINSDITELVTTYKLSTPEHSIGVDENNNQCYIWKSVNRASSYIVYIDGVVSDLSVHNYGDDYYFVPSFSQIGTYKIQIVAHGDNGSTTIDSSACEFNQTVKQLATPDFTYSYSKEYVDNNDGEVILTITQVSPYATGYRYVYGASASQTETSSSTTTEFRFNPHSVGTYTLGVYALGGGFDEEGAYYIDSQLRGNNSSYTIKLLANTETSGIQCSKDGVLTWNKVTDATKYKITLTYNGTTIEYTTATNVASINLSDLIKDSAITSLAKDGKFVVTIQSIGSGDGKVISSIITTSNELNVPKDITA